MTNLELSEREREVAGLVAEGLTNSEIGRRLYISMSTVKTHVSVAMSKCNARNRTQLALTYSRPKPPIWHQAPY